MHNSPIRIAVVDDHEVITAGVEAMLRPYAARVQVLPWPGDASVDVALFDWLAAADRYPHGLDTVVGDPGIGRVAIYTWWSTAGLIEVASRKGVAGYVSKRLSAARLVGAIEQVMATSGMVVVAGSDDQAPHVATGPASTLTERESEVLALLIEGRSNRAIASTLFVSIDTVKTHLRAVYRKLGVANRTQAVVRALESDF
jgi:DNA-binding NarL/FixJ family response regulator